MLYVWFSYAIQAHLFDKKGNPAEMRAHVFRQCHQLFIYFGIQGFHCPSHKNYMASCMSRSSTSNSTTPPAYKIRVG
uniref:Uncharacterized protein n=1 Tax=Candidatus Kentrum sp. SD TaxID=2126332 RepID=A0A450YPR0_9GAMM|nr:MAG: hypothetical protein BECKSD772F_GA0070984_11488 [Candidatus Kentron sp. SD]VFK80779.1 MAG: hypothetical protein BECKSD772D_GA0070982_11556 [Candidatus Kentron sp. SD]